MEERMELISYKEIDDEKKEIIYSVVNKIRKGTLKSIGLPPILLS